MGELGNYRKRQRLIEMEVRENEGDKEDTVGV